MRHEQPRTPERDWSYGSWAGMDSTGSECRSRECCTTDEQACRLADCNARRIDADEARPTKSCGEEELGLVVDFGFEEEQDET